MKNDIVAIGQATPVHCELAVCHRTVVVSEWRDLAYAVAEVGLAIEFVPSQDCFGGTSRVQTLEIDRHVLVEV